MSEQTPITFIFSREEFYDKLWLMPTTKLAAELGGSDVIIGKIFKSHNIPKPCVTYWMERGNPNTDLL